MQEVFKKIIEKLEEERDQSYADFESYVFEYSQYLDSEYDDFFHKGLERASRLVKQVAAEYNNECNHKWVFQEKQLKTEVSGYENYTAHYHRTDVYFCEKCCEIKNVEKKESVRLPFGGIHHLQKYAPIWYQPEGE